MKKLLLLVLFVLPFWATAAQVRQVTAETTHMPANTLTERFSLKSGEKFTQQEYEKAQHDLQKTGMFKKIEFAKKEYQDGVDIHIKADDRRYIMPMIFGLSGNKHAVGASVLGRNLLGRGEEAYLFVGGGRDGFDSHGYLHVGKHTYALGYRHINFNQRLYEGGWVSNPEIFSSADDKNKHNSRLLDDVHGKQDDFYVMYRYQFSSIWSASIKPEYEYYTYKNDALDTGNHSHVTVGLHYADDIRPGINMEQLAAMEHMTKQDMLRDLPRLQVGKLAEITYTAGGDWSGSDYNIDILALSGAYLWELKTRHVLALFAKGQRAFDAPFSNKISSSDLLFGMGIYDREQRGKGGVSGGLSFTYYALRNQAGLLSITPFFEQAYITSGGNSYEPHSGIGVAAGLRLWAIPLPIGLSFTHNLNDGSHHISCKVGGKF